MRSPHRFRDPVALALSLVFGIAGGYFALRWPLPWLAAMVGPLIFLAVLLISTRHTTEPPVTRVEPPVDTAGIVREWTRNVDGGHPARGPADRAFALVGDIEDLDFECRMTLRNIADDADREAKERWLDEIKTFYRGTVDMYPGAPRSLVEWDTLVRRLERVREWLRAEQTPR
jgi:hypothetical protein